ncbi:MAG: Modulator of FtsH protease HflK [Deltaproteobacteria bacterium ADurb.Bin207]|nr:MAG: Modulator of FtsH protease HflK [Deltaproteobacteria bacterium ADurb.Bin207]
MGQGEPRRFASIRHALVAPCIERQPRVPIVLRPLEQTESNIMRSQFGRNGGWKRPDSSNIEQVSEAVRRNKRKLGPIILGVLLLIAILTGVYSVNPGEQGVVRTFGKETGKTGPGLHFALPIVQKVDVVNVEQIRRVEIGFRGKERVPSESLMLTGDENIVEAQVIVQYRVIDPSKYLFRLRDPEQTVLATAEVALRSVIGRTTIDDAMTTGREEVQSETRSQLQTLMDTYQSGIAITEVKLQMVDAPDEVREAFHDVVRAREEKEQKINKAKGYNEDLIPRARGEARQVVRAAEAYKQQRELRANGDVANFLAVLEEYRKAEKVTRDRLYLETMERILRTIDKKTLVDRDVTKNALPVLNLGPAVVGGQAGGK